MALNIKDPETDRVVRQLAEETGETITVALRTAAEERLVRVRQRNHRAGVRPALQAYIDRARARQVLDARTADAVIGYDADGLPQ